MIRCHVGRLSGALCLMISHVAISRAAVTNLAETFEGNFANWVVRDANTSGTPAYWGIVTTNFGSSPNGGSRKAYCAGTGFSGTTTAPRYRDDMTAQLDRVVNLSGQAHATLRIRHRIAGIEAGYERARILVDGVELWSLSAGVPHWTNLALNLDAFAGAPRLLRFEFRSDSSQTYEGWYLDDVLVTDELLPPEPPANDEFAKAADLPGCCGVMTGDFSHSTSSPGEPLAPEPSVWFSWKSPTNGAVTFWTTGSSFGAHLCAFTGTNITALMAVRCDPDRATNTVDGIRFEAVAGQSYLVQMTSRQVNASHYVVRWEQPSGIGQLLLPDLSVGIDESREWLHGWFLDSSTQPGRVLLRISTATLNLGRGPLELRGNSTVPGVVQRIFHSNSGFSERYAGTFTFHPGHTHLHFDNWVNFHLRSVLPEQGIGDIVASGGKTSFAVIDLLPYDLSLPDAPVTDVYSDGLIQGISVGWADIYDSSLPDQWIDVTGIPAGSYWLEVMVDPEDRILESNETNNVSRLRIDFPGVTRPGNDVFTNAQVIAGVTAGLRASNYNSTRDASEPAHAGNVAGASIWYRWTAPSNMTVRLSTQGSSIDTVLAVYRGTAVNALTQVMADDDTGGGGASLLTFSATGGVTYSIAIDGYRLAGGLPATGSLQLHFNPAWNDSFARPVRLSGPSGWISGSSRFATRESGEPLHAGLSGTSSIWYSWIAPRRGRVTLDTLGSGFDTLLAVYRGTGVGALVPVASNDNGAGSGLSRVTFEASAGENYRIAIAGRSNAIGLVTLNWTYADLPPVFVTPPVGTNVVAGGTHVLSGLVSGTEPLFYRWEHNDLPVLGSERILGATSPALTLSKLGAADAGVYRLVVTNSYGAVTSSPAYLVVMQNPRILFVDETIGPIGGLAAARVMLEALGTERFVELELQWDPSQLEFRGLTNTTTMGVTNRTADLTRAGQGRLRLTLDLADPASMPVRPIELTTLVFFVPPGSAAGSHAPIGFGLPRAVRDAERSLLNTVFLPGIVELEAIESSLDLSALLRGSNELVIQGVAGREYVVESSLDLSRWTVVAIRRADLTGRVVLSLPGAGTERQQFYRAQLLP